MEAKLTTSLAILTALLIMHHPSITAAATIAHHTTTPANASLAAGFSLQLVVPDHDDLDHTVRRGSDGFLHLQSLRTDLPPRPPSGANSSSAASATTLRPEMTYTPLRLPKALVIGVGTGAGHQDYLFQVVDTSSHLIWMQCMGCDPHSPQRHRLFDSTTSPTYHLVAGTDPFCRPPYWSEFNGEACAFRFDGPRDMSVEGYLGTDQLTYNNAVHQNVPFGCAHKAHHFQNDGVFAGVIGAAAVARGLTRFSYCLFHGGETNRQGFLRFGTDVPRNPRYRTTEILPAAALDAAHDSSGHYVSLVGVSLGARRLDGIRPEMFARREDGQGGCVVDLGTPVTVMARAAYDVVEEAVWSDLERHGAERVGRRGYGLCVRASEAMKGRLQSLSLHFSGDEEAVLVVAPEQLFLMMDDEQGRIACLAVTPGRRTVIGALQQVDTRFVFDLKDSKLSFAPESCIRDTVPSKPFK
ncbi:hypothetical protein SETIT_4G090300v2 [Setaria italica]|uniref:Peptidase A1 domain-containing protein n=2 Tax=Setaria TaxID=4554 RepID=A0A368QSF7_SETIT|nr:aspartyl protease family protein 2-like [Setaria italica]RCV20842.1 hypothetical protein SETIT_4G090300v2 [Setaria italica]